MSGELAGVRLLAVRDCATCGRLGAIEHPLWTRFWQLNGPGPHGANLDGLVREASLEGVPESIPCPDCDGQGVRKLEVDLADLRADLVGAMRVDQLTDERLDELLGEVRVALTDHALEA